MEINDEKLNEMYNLFWKSLGFMGEYSVNHGLAFKTIKELSEAGYDYATLMLGICYCDGIGTDCDKQKGMLLIEQAQKAGFPMASAILMCIAELESGTYKNAYSAFRNVAGHFSDAYCINYYRFHSDR